MKHFNIAALLFSTLISVNSWGLSTFTNVTQLDNAIYAGVKSVEPEMEMESYLIEVNVKDLSSKKVSLPSDIVNREIVGLVPARDHLIVITQNTRGGGDRPLIHSLAQNSKSWKQIGEVDCISFANINVTSTFLEFSCEETSPKGEVKKVNKQIDTKILLKSQSLKLPVTQFKSEQVEASLIEEDLDLTKLKVTKGKQEKIFTP